MKITSFLYLSAALLLVSCGGRNQSQDTTQETAVVEEVAEPAKTVFDVLGKSDIYAQPSDGDKVLNQKATNALGETTYCSIDPSTTVKILEENGDWVKIQVVSPDWLSSSHIGWVKASLIDRGEEQPIQLKEREDYKVLLTESKGNVTNYYIQNITCELDEVNLLKFAKALKAQFGDNCNIQIYEDASVKDLMTKYPLKGQEYIKVADKFVFELSFDGSSSFYPFQDIQYKEFGGNNWKKTPIE